MDALREFLSKLEPEDVATLLASMRNTLPIGLATVSPELNKPEVEWSKGREAERKRRMEAEAKWMAEALPEAYRKRLEGISSKADLYVPFTPAWAKEPFTLAEEKMSRPVKRAQGGEVTVPDMNDGGQVIPDVHPFAGGGPVNFGKGGITEIEDLLKAGKTTKAAPRGGLKMLADPLMEASSLERDMGMTAAQRAAAGRRAADVAKAIEPLRMSEALGNLNLEGKGKLKITQSDRTRVGGGNIGGAMFPGLQQVDPIYEGAVWGVGEKGTASRLINQSDPDTVWSTVLGSADQLKTNPLVFNKLRQGFVSAMKEGKLSDDLADKINQNLEVTFGEGADIRDPKIWRRADTFEKRAALADVMMGQGLPPSKGGVPLGGEKSGKGVIFQPSEILIRETEPLLLHPEHGGDVPTFAVGPRLFTLSGEVKQRPDLHPGFPYILQGEDTGMVFKPAPGEVAMRDFASSVKKRGRSPGYYDWAMGLKGEGLPSQLITEEYLTHLQKAGHAEGGSVNLSDELDALEMAFQNRR